jgi:hypothetical protein
MTTMKTSIASKELPSSGQKENVINLITDAVRKGAGLAWDELVKNGVLNKHSAQRILTRGNEVATAALSAATHKMAELAESISGCLRLIEITLQPTNGSAIIANATDVFNWVDPDFKNWGTDVSDNPTGQARVRVYEMVKDGNLQKIFCGLSDDLNLLCLTQDQIIQFVKKHRRYLRTEGHATFFLFKVGNEFFVAYVYLHSGGRLEVFVRRFSDDYVWSAGYLLNRVVVLATGT